MRRIYDSDALARDDDSAFAPREANAPSSRGFVDWAALSHAVLPTRVRDRAIETTVRTPADAYRRGEPIPVRVILRNRLPVPVSIRTTSPRSWVWAVDGFPDAARHSDGDPPDDRRLLTLARRERKVFDRTWSGKFRVDDRVWEPAEEGPHVVSAWVNVDRHRERGLYDSTDVRIE